MLGRVFKAVEFLIGKETGELIFYCKLARLLLFAEVLFLRKNLIEFWLFRDDMLSGIGF